MNKNSISQVLDTLSDDDGSYFIGCLDPLTGNHTTIVSRQLASILEENDVYTRFSYSLDLASYVARDALKQQAANEQVRANVSMNIRAIHKK